ncbi:MAG: (2Fe-2S)-binding protein [Clostridia bacterium]|nr:(2Fe-2S)-binding protein [Clostridia bacterium]
MGEDNTKTIILNVNGRDRKIHDVRNSDTLADVLRNKLGLLGTKISCDEGACGACTVIVDGEAALSCMVLAVSMEGKSIVTIEGLSSGNELHPIQEAYLEERGYACGYCTPGFVMTTKVLLDHNPNPTKAEIKEAIAGNICHCGVYEHIEKAIEKAAEKIRAGE